MLLRNAAAFVFHTTSKTCTYKSFTVNKLDTWGVGNLNQCTLLSSKQKSHDNNKKISKRWLMNAELTVHGVYLPATTEVLYKANLEEPTLN